MINSTLKIFYTRSQWSCGKDDTYEFNKSCLLFLPSRPIKKYISQSFLRLGEGMEWTSSGQKCEWKWNVLCPNEARKSTFEIFQSFFCCCDHGNLDLRWWSHNMKHPWSLSYIMEHESPRDLPDPGLALVVRSKLGVNTWDFELDVSQQMADWYGSSMEAI